MPFPWRTPPGPHALGLAQPRGVRVQPDPVARGGSDDSGWSALNTEEHTGRGSLSRPLQSFRGGGRSSQLGFGFSCGSELPPCIDAEPPPWAKDFCFPLVLGRKSRNMWPSNCFIISSFSTPHLLL